MTWLFAILVVVALGGVAVVAAGRAGVLPEAERDLVRSGLPEGVLGADDLRRVRFPLALRGYRMADVDAVLDRLATQLEPGRDEAPRETVPDGGHGGDTPAM